MKRRITVLAIILGILACVSYGSTCMCPMIYMPVCDENGKKYSNKCRANCAGVTITKPCDTEPSSTIETQNCGAVRCALPSCGPGFHVDNVPGKCCPQCLPDLDCSAVLCLRADCKHGYHAETLPFTCCPRCVEDAIAI
jgi:hypothetical protein